MTIVAYDELVHLLDSGVIQDGKHSAAGGSSIDIHLGPTIIVENPAGFPRRVIDYRERDQFDGTKVVLDEDGFELFPGQFILAHTVEKFEIPLNLSALLRTKSSMGRIGLEHLDAGWVDPGFSGALTLELTNTLRHHAIRIRPGDAIGQLVFFRHEMVEYDNSYKAKGRYSGSDTVEQTRKAR